MRDDGQRRGPTATRSFPGDVEEGFKSDSSLGDGWGSPAPKPSRPPIRDEDGASPGGRQR